MNYGTRGIGLAAALGTGYLLGRTRKMRLALTLAAIGATGKFGVRPSAPVERKLKQLGASEVGKIAETVRGELLSAVKDAATSAATGQINALTERISAGLPETPSLPGRGRKGEAEQDEEKLDTRARGEEPEEDEDEGEGEEEEEQRPVVRRATRTRSGGAGRGGAAGGSRRPASRRRDEDEEDEEERAPRTRRRQPAATSGRKR